MPQKVDPSHNRRVFSRKLRFALGFIGVVGGVLWFFLGGLILLFSGFKPGGNQGGMSDGEWALCIAPVLFTFIYYGIVSCLVWSRFLLWCGIALHVLWAIAVVCIFTLSDGGFILTPLFFPGLACWTAYAIIAHAVQITSTPAKADGAHS